jgi:Acetyltransferase (GNAT) domain
MELFSDSSQMLNSALEHQPSSVIAEFDHWKVVPLELTVEKIRWLWDEMNKYKSLFSSLTIGDINNFAAVFAQPDSIWFDVQDEHGNTVGILSMTDLKRVIDCEVHMMFFDRKPHEKVHLCKLLIEYVFEQFPLRRMTATIPSIYYSTVRLVQKIGFHEEGRKAQSQLIGNRWVDEVIFGLLRQEVL